MGSKLLALLLTLCLLLGTIPSAAFANTVDLDEKETTVTTAPEKTVEKQEPEKQEAEEQKAEEQSQENKDKNESNPAAAPANEATQSVPAADSANQKNEATVEIPLELTATSAPVNTAEKEVYISPMGDDSKGNGSLEKPFESVNQACKTLNKDGIGGTILVMPAVDEKTAVLNFEIAVTSKTTITSCDSAGNRTPDSPNTIMRTAQTGKLLLNTATSDLTLDSVILDGGHEKGNRFFKTLGILNVEQGKATLNEKVVIQNCYSEYEVGAGVNVTGGRLIMNGSTIKKCQSINSNKEKASAGGMYLGGGDVEIHSATITDCISGFDYSCGGIFFAADKGGTLTLGTGPIKISKNTRSNLPSNIYIDKGSSGSVINMIGAQLAEGSEVGISKSADKFPTDILQSPEGTTLSKKGFSSDKVLEFTIGTKENAENILQLKDAPRYSITLDKMVKNGSIKVNGDKSEEKAGLSVTVTATPNTGYILDTITVKQGDNPINVKVDKTKKTGTFTMPAGDVEVSASFEAVDVPVESVALDKVETTISAGETLSLTATVKPENATDKDLSWTSTNEDAATVDNTGKITAKAEGKTVITVTTVEGEKTASCVVTVIPKTYAISIDPKIENGSIKVKDDKNTEEAGKTVTITAMPNTGYELSLVTAKQGETAIEVTQTGNTAEFTMPAGDVEVSACFKEVNTPLKKAEAEVKALLNGYTATNITTAEGLLMDINNSIVNTGATAAWKDPSDVKMIEATTKAPGSFTGTVVLTAEEKDVEVSVSLIIAKLENYKVVEGANSNWTAGSKTGLTIKSDVDLNKFVKVTINGKELDKANYDVKSGSTIVTLKPEYLTALEPGTYEVKMIFTDGEANTTFTIKGTPTPPSPNPKKPTQSSTNVSTGITDTQTGTYCAVILLALAGIGMLGFKRKINK